VLPRRSAEATAHPREVAEQALAHALPDRVEAAYRRGDMLERRRRLMEEWAAPFPGAATVLAPQSGPWHGDLHRPERTGQLPHPVPVPMADRSGRAPPVAAAPERRLELLLDQFLDQAADPAPYPGLERIEPSIPGEQPVLRRPLAATFVHGVVSTGAPTPVMAC
jgi:hypothetical protein